VIEDNGGRKHVVLTPLSWIREHSFIPLTLYPRRGSRGISDIPLKRPLYTKII
jgi:hypothetical protein